MSLGWGAIAAVTVGLGGMAMLASTPSERELGQYSTSLTGRTKSQRHNAVRVLGELQGVIIPAGAEFSFNQHVRGWTKDMGYRQAPVSYNGQLVDSWGGGVCQTSTTMYNAALEAGLVIVERNRHRFAPSYVPPGRDAAVAFENIDLKFRNPYRFPIRILGQVRGDRLWLSFTGAGTPNKPVRVYQQVRESRAPQSFIVKGPKTRVRNTGKSGFEVLVWRDWGTRQELISQDDYPAMNRIVEIQ